MAVRSDETVAAKTFETSVDRPSTEPPDLSLVPEKDSDDSSPSLPPDLRRLIWIAAVVAVAPAVVMGMRFVALGQTVPSSEPEYWGVLGDFSGGIANPILAVLNIYAFLKVAEAVRHHEKSRDKASASQELERLKFAEEQEKRNRELQMQIAAAQLRPALALDLRYDDRSGPGVVSNSGVPDDPELSLQIYSKGLGPALVREVCYYKKVGPEIECKKYLHELIHVAEIRRNMLTCYEFFDVPSIIGPGEVLSLFRMKSPREGANPGDMQDRDGAIPGNIRDFIKMLSDVWVEIRYDDWLEKSNMITTCRIGDLLPQRIIVS